MSAVPRVALAPLAAVLWVALLAAGCGTATGPPPGPPVTLTLSAPADGSRVSAQSAIVSGTVSPASARVQVLGREVRVASDGRFAIAVGLGVGTNLIDVEASAPRSTGAVAAVRVIRYLLVAVPALTGESPTVAGTALSALGLAVKVQGSSNPLNFLFPGATKVCSSSPVAGTRVDPGSTVTIKTSRFCL
jgi:hypothetical protein